MAAIKEWPARRCSGDSCRQGRAECKTPQACEVPEPLSNVSPTTVALLGLGAMLVSAIVAVLFLAWAAASAWEWLRPVLT
jgi:hypothetical protein